VIKWRREAEQQHNMEHNNIIFGKRYERRMVNCKTEKWKTVDSEAYGRIDVLKERRECMEGRTV